ncbi:subclass B3 metallo-beta-lactamase [Tsuneonella sp. HG222]
MYVRTLGAALLVAACAAPSPAPAPPAKALTNPPSAWAARCADNDEWDKPGPPFRLYGNTYYVGTCGISAILVTGEAGHVLIDGSTDAGASVVAANIEQLGFKLSDVKILLISHEHIDHAGGVARLQQATGGRLLVSAPAKPVMETGAVGPDDPVAGMFEPFPAARVDGTVRDGEVVRLGNIAITAIATPGHTDGAFSWTWDTDPTGPDRWPMVYADSMTPASNDSYRFTAHPERVAALRRSINRVGALDCTRLVTPHPSAAGLRQAILDTGAPAVREGACRDYAAALRKRLDGRLAEEARGG